MTPSTTQATRCGRPAWRWLAPALIVAFASLVGAAATWVVTTTDDSGPGSLREAVEMANDSPGADLVSFDAALTGQTITLSSGELLVTDDLTIEGPNGGRVTVRRADIATTPFRIFNIDDGADTVIRVGLRNLTISGGEVRSVGYVAGMGGGISSAENLTIEDCAVSGNRVYGSGVDESMGGGVYSSGTLTVLRSEVTSNRVEGWNVREAQGGGIYSSGSLLVRNTTIAGNDVVATDYVVNARGGGVASIGDLEIRASTITDNRAVSGSYIAGAHGGGIYSIGSLEIARTTVANNVSSAGGIDIRMSGGGLHGSGRVWNSTFSGNRTGTTSYHGEGGTAFGGGLYGDLWIHNTTVVGNRADIGGTDPGRVAGGGVYAGRESRLVSTIVADNEVDAAFTDGPDAFRETSWRLAHHNLIGDPTDSGVTIGEDGNITGDPQLGPLQANGGPNLTCALAPSSPAVDSGSNPLSLVGDQRGFRPRGTNGTVDIGSYEVGATDVLALLFADSFESGSTGAWSQTSP